MRRPDLFDGLVPARPPAGLREQVLGAAREAAAHGELRDSERLWSDRAVRWALGATLVLALANAGLTTTGKSHPEPPRLDVPPSMLGGDERALPAGGGDTAAGQLRENPSLARECGVSRG